MDMTLKELKKVLAGAAAVLKESEEKLSAIDAETGDGDHGVTIGKIAAEIQKKSIEETDENETIKDFFSDLYDRIMGINGGSAGPLWGMMIDGVSESLSDEKEANPSVIKAMFKGALEGLESVSDAQIGDKTMMDALGSAAQAAQSAPDDSLAILKAAAEGGRKGAEDTRNMIAKYGRAKNLHERSLGHLDAGAVSVAIMIEAIYDQVK